MPLNLEIDHLRYIEHDFEAQRNKLIQILTFIPQSLEIMFIVLA